MTFFIILWLFIGILIAWIIIELATHRSRLDRKIKEMMDNEPWDMSDSGSELNK